jgi:hypothetical protein
MTDRLYPLARPTSGTDARFTFGLIYDVGQVLESHNFPPVRGGDHVTLMSALFQFLYAKEEQPAPAPAAYGDAERDGTRCISCHEDFAPTDVGERERIPAGVIDGGRMGFAHHVCIFPSRASESAALDAKFGTAPAVSAPEGSRREDDEIKGTGADLPTVHYAHAMTGKGAQTPRCGAAGQTVLFAYNVTCPRCLALLAQEGTTSDAPLLHAAPPIGSGRAPRCGASFGATALNKSDVTCRLCRAILDRERIDAAITASGQDVVAELAAAVIEEWVPRSVAPLPVPRKLWVHSGPCIYCSHGPGCVTCDLTKGPDWGAGPEYPGPVCRHCSEECQRREITADPYYSGDYVTMFGDDE